jgi:hypothetical protein
MWVRSFWAADQVTYESNHVVGKHEEMTAARLWSTKAGLEISFTKGVGRANPTAEMSWFHHFVRPPFTMSWMVERGLLRRHGFYFTCGPSDTGYVNSVIASWSWGFTLGAPYWFLFIGLLIFPAWRIYRNEKHQKRDGSTCPSLWLRPSRYAGPVPGVRRPAIRFRRNSLHGYETRSRLNKASMVLQRWPRWRRVHL